MDLNSLGTFDANQHQPKQLGGIVPPGKWPAVIANTDIVPTKAGDGGMFVVDFDTPHGRISMRYNLWNPSAKAVEIAHGQFSALCHATGVYKVDFPNKGASLRNAQLMIEVQLQDSDKPDGYTEVKRVYDKNGNEPGKAPAAAPQTTQGNGANAAPAWGGQPAASAGQQSAQPAWGATQAQPQQQAPQAAPTGWQPGPTQAGNSAPPWANK